MGPVVFDNCRGWLHPGASRRGIVICGAHGFEDLCSRTSLAILAETIAARGCPVLRFDWRGAGDSEGDEGGEDRAAVWLLNVAAAVRTLIAQTGVDEIVLVGLRLGALLALHAAPDIRPCKLVLLAPPASGRAFVREIEMMARIFPSGGDAAYDGLDVAGFRIARATLDQLRAFKTQDIANLAGLDTLLMGPDDDGGPLKASLANAGLALRVAPFEGYAQMMCDPTAATPPAAALARIADFCVEGARPARAPKTPAPGGVLQTSQWREEAAQFGQDKQLVGIFCAPVAGAAGARTIVFLNAGGVYHVGWARMTVEMARRLAQADTQSSRELINAQQYRLDQETLRGVLAHSCQPTGQSPIPLCRYRVLTHLRAKAYGGGSEVSSVHRWCRRWPARLANSSNQPYASLLQRLVVDRSSPHLLPSG